MAKVTRGFSGRPRPGGDRRLPPGQYDTGADWPVLTAEPTPRISTDEWWFAVDGLVERPSRWTWEEMHALPASTYEGPIHCVTTWSKFAMTFTGVSVDVLLEASGPAPEATHVLASSHTGYTTNLPLADVTGGKAWVTWEVDGAPLPADHGGPARLLVPHLYFWKSAKWVAGLTLGDHDEPGFWSATATTTVVTPGSSSATRGTEHGDELAGGHRGGHPGRDGPGQDVPAAPGVAGAAPGRPALRGPPEGT